MKKSSLLVFCGALAVALPFASLSAKPEGGPKGPGMNVEKRLEKMKENLGLSDAQTASIKAIFDEQKTQLEPIFADETLTREQKREKAKPIMDVTQMKVDGVLTAEQKAKLDEKKGGWGKGKEKKKDQ